MTSLSDGPCAANSFPLALYVSITDRRYLRIHADPLISPRRRTMRSTEHRLNCDITSEAHAFQCQEFFM